ncbi:Uma2 family endonuclease [Alkalihalobacillus xiaoxiensis]|uniref:Uma2 family endonuclease n=1 Tax=Shouchella xiaoxiensis TaxID=766895 RepID=A0ABS2SYQ5_9BACI|nr:Uma2 family endonuclease [Shouchella xiaoxiensis]MBM7839895.1 Uma2 family endonuclease [Shouchella xiaoxiensis]
MSAHSQPNRPEKSQLKSLQIRKARILNKVRYSAITSNGPSTNLYKRMTFSEFERFREQEGNREKQVEFIDNFVYMAPSPTIKHQRISRELLTGIHLSLKNTDCEVFDAPTDLVLTIEDTQNVVIPDVFVVCNLDEEETKRVTKTPLLVIEILSNNRVDDEVTKFVKYEQAGIPEYWIVDPEERVITQYILNAENKYPAKGHSFKAGTITSVRVPSYTADVGELLNL